MSTLLLVLTGPLAAWGNGRRVTPRPRSERDYGPDDGGGVAPLTWPTKRNLVGLLAAAQGRRRYTDMGDLIALDMSVRGDYPGAASLDFHTTMRRGSKGPLRQLRLDTLMCDSCFVAGIEGDGALIEDLAAALRRPVYAPYLGRRACPPSRPVLLDVAPADLVTALDSTPLQLSPVMRRHLPPRITVHTRSHGPGPAGMDDSWWMTLPETVRLHDNPLAESSPLERALYDRSEPDFLDAYR